MLRRLAAMLGSLTPGVRWVIVLVWLVLFGLSILLPAIRRGEPGPNEWINVWSLLIGVVGFPANVGINVLAHWFIKSQEKRFPAVKAFFSNHDLSRLVGLSLGMICRSVADNKHLKVSGSDRGTLHGLAKRFEKEWATICQSAWAIKWLEGIQDRQLTAYVRDVRKPALEAERWRELVRGITQTYGIPAPSEKIEERLIEELGGRFGEALRLALKRDFVYGGEAWGAMQLDMAASLLNGATAQANRQDPETREAVDAAHHELKDSLKTIERKLDRHHAEVREQVETVLGLLGRILEHVEDIREDTGVIRRHVEAAVRDEVVPIEHAESLYGDEGNPRAFRPMLREFQEGLVYESPLVNEVLESLSDRQWAYLRGVMASGKSVAATHVALRFIATRGKPAFYMDFANPRVDDRVGEVSGYALELVSKSEGLLVVDNIHRNSSAAKRLWNIWKDTRTGYLLLVGRWAESPELQPGQADPLSGLNRHVVELVTQTEDLLGVYRRLMKRYTQSNDVIDPPPEAVRQWHNWYGGKLVDFNWAVYETKDRLQSNDWSALDDKSAIKFIKKMIKGVSSAVIERFAALSSVELDVPVGIFEDHEEDIAPLLQQGFIHRRFIGPLELFSLAHPADGALLASANEITPADISRCLGEVATTRPGFAYAIIWRLDQAGRTDDAMACVDRILKAKSLARCFEWGLVAGVAKVKLFTRLSGRSYSEFDDLLCAGLENKKHRETLVSAALKTPLDHLGSFLRFARGDLPKLHEWLIQELESEKHRETLVSAALTTPLGHLGSFLRFARGDLPKLHEWLIQELESEKHRETLVIAALKTPLDDLGSFLQFAQDSLPLVHAGIIAMADQFLPRVYEAPLGKLKAFYDIEPFRAYLIPKMVVKKWDRLRSFEEVEAVTALVKRFRTKGRDDLVDFMCTTLMRVCPPTRWNQPTVYLPQVATVLAGAKSASQDVLESFVDRVLTPGWLAKAYQQKDTHGGVIAGAIYSVWCQWGMAVAGRLWHPALEIRRDNAIRRLTSASDPRETSRLIQLIGACALLGYPPRSSSEVQPARINAAADSPTAIAELDYLGHIQVQFLLGVRAMESMNGGMFSQDLRQRYAELLDKTKAATPPEQELLGSLRSWLLIGSGL